MLQVNNISGGYGQHPVVNDVSFCVERGKIVGVLGPNGSGKSTLLKMISGVIPSTHGDVLLDGKPIASYPTKQLAQKMAVLPQLHANAFSNTVRETVSLGRYPYQRGLFASWSKDDEMAVLNAIEATGISRYIDVDMSQLSGGEQQRVFIAQALAQQSQLLILDEPTNHLDIAHQKQILDLIREQVDELQLTVLSVFHDINLASLYCDELLLLEDGKIRMFGKPHEVVMQGEIQQVYEAPVTTYAHPELPKPQITMMPNTVEQPDNKITKQHFSITKDFVQLKTPIPLKTISSAVHNAGLGWYDTFLNRNVSLYYEMEDVNEETKQFLQQHQFGLTNTVVMLTAVETEHVVIDSFQQDGIEILVAVTAGVGNAVDVSKSYLREQKPYVGTINIWLIVNGKLTDEAFYQAMMTVTEAKAKALADAKVFDKVSNTIATGTGTDSLLVAATQVGEKFRYAGTITKLGQLIGKAVYEVTMQAIHNYNKAKRNG